jgi:hypothetical protein
MTVQRMVALLCSVYAAAQLAVDGVAETPSLLQRLAEIRHAIRLKLTRLGCSYDDLARIEADCENATLMPFEGGNATARDQDTLRDRKDYGPIALQAHEADEHSMSLLVLVDEAIGSANAAALILPVRVVPNVMYEMLLSNTFALDGKCSSEHPMLHQMRAAVDTALLLSLAAELKMTPPRHDSLLVAFSGLRTSMLALERTVQAAPRIEDLLGVGPVTCALASWEDMCGLVTAVYEYCATALYHTRMPDSERSRLKARLHHKTVLGVMQAAASATEEERSAAQAHALVGAVLFLRKISEGALLGAVNGFICQMRCSLEEQEDVFGNILRRKYRFERGADCPPRTWAWLQRSLQRQPRGAKNARAAPLDDAGLHNSVATAVLDLVCTMDLQDDQCMLPETLALDVTRVRQMRERFSLYTRVCCIVSLVVSWMEGGFLWANFEEAESKKMVAEVAQALARCLVETSIPHDETLRLALAALQKLRAVTAKFSRMDEVVAQRMLLAVGSMLGDPAHEMLVKYASCFRQFLVYAVNTPAVFPAAPVMRHRLDHWFSTHFIDALATTMQPLATSLVEDVRSMVSNNLKLHKELYNDICRATLQCEPAVSASLPGCAA